MCVVWALLSFNRESSAARPPAPDALAVCVPWSALEPYFARRARPVRVESLAGELNQNAAAASRLLVAGVRVQVAPGAPESPWHVAVQTRATGPFDSGLTGRIGPQQAL
jgi:hypothetical protein